MTESTGNNERLDHDIYTAAVGPEQAAYYLRKFERFQSGGSRISWNWPCFFVSFFWLLYRKMWLWAALYLVLPWPVFLIIGLIGAFATPLVIVFGVIAYYIGVWLILPLYANALYFRHVQKKVAQVTNSIKAPERAIAYLAGQGGTSGAAAAIAIVVMGFYWVAMVGILAAISIPVYQDYVMRASVAGAYIATQPARQVVASHLTQQSGFPATLDASVAPDSIGRNDYQASMRYLAETGQLQLEFKNGNLADKLLVLTPQLLENGKVVWRCSSDTLQAEWLPAVCSSSTN